MCSFLFFCPTDPSSRGDGKRNILLGWPNMITRRERARELPRVRRITHACEVGLGISSLATNARNWKRFTFDLKRTECQSSHGIGLLQQTITWYKIRHAGVQVMCRKGSLEMACFEGCHIFCPPAWRNFHHVTVCWKRHIDSLQSYKLLIHPKTQR